MYIRLAVGIFLLLETFNVLALYFNPETQKANAMGAFIVWEKSKTDEDTHLLLKYMANWVAGTKIIFIFLLLVVLIFGDEQLQLYSLAVLVFAISTYYWRLQPLMDKMDSKGLITPEGYSKTLTQMITIFILVLSTAGIIELLL